MKYTHRLKRFLRTARSFFTQIDWAADNWREQLDWWWHWHKWGYGDRVPPLAWAEEISQRELKEAAKSFLIKPQLFEPRTSASYAPYLETGRLRPSIRMSGYYSQKAVKYTDPTIT